MKITEKDQLNEIFEQAFINDDEYIAVLVQFDNRDKPEIIINHKSNFHYKLNYYNSVYDFVLDHKHANNVRITDACSGNSLSEIEYVLTEKEIRGEQ